MNYIVVWKSKAGWHTIMKMNNMQDVTTRIIKNFKNKLETIAYADEIDLRRSVGQVWKNDGEWTYSYDKDYQEI